MTTALRLAAAFLVIASLLYPQSNKGKKPRASEAEVAKIEVRRDGEAVLLDGTIRNTGMRPLLKVVLSFEFYAPNRESLAVQNGPVDADVIGPGEEAEFHLQARYPARAVEIRLEARDKDKRDLNLDRGGPYAIE